MLGDFCASLFFCSLIQLRADARDLGRSSALRLSVGAFFSLEISCEKLKQSNIFLVTKYFNFFTHSGILNFFRKLNTLSKE